MPMATLSERDMRILAFERSWWRQPGAKEQAISDMLGLSATRYYQLLNDLIDRPEALGFDPVLVKRLRRQRSRRNRMRAGGPEAGASGTPLNAPYQTHTSAGAGHGPQPGRSDGTS